jgi:patatin-related protein
MPENGKELRLALGMRGGVSLAVWIGGVCAEIDELLRADREGNRFWDRCLTASEYERVVVDVMAGASAGGLNGVLFASSIRHGFPISCMRDVWNVVGDIDGLRRNAPPWPSVLDGDGVFLRTVYEGLTELVQTADDGRARRPQVLDLRLSATLVEPVVMTTIGPDDERLTRTRSSATFHFRYDADVPVASDDFASDPAALRRLALAARATAAFPGAFEPAVVRSNRPGAFGERLALVDDPLVDCGGVFSEREGPCLDRGDPAPTDFLVADGGIVDNIPLGKAIEAIAAVPADRPTKRYLLYLHPSGPSAMRFASPGDSAALSMEERRGLVAVVRGAATARLAGESIDGDIAQLEAQRRAANLARRLRQLTFDSVNGASISGVAAVQFPAYRVQRAVVGAAYLRRLLDDPVGALGADPFPVPPADGYTPPSDRWRAPLTRWPPGARDELDAALASAGTGGEKVDASLFRVGLGPLRRVNRLVIEWMRAMEDANGVNADVGVSKRRLYELLWLLTSVLDRRRNLGWVVRAGVIPDHDKAQEWCDETLQRLDRLLQAPPGLASEIVGGDGPATRTYMETCDAALQLLVQPASLKAFEKELSPIRRAGSEVDLRTVILGVIVEQVAKVVAASRPLADGHPASLLDLVLRTVDVDIDLRLAMLEVLCFPEFLAGSSGSEPIDFRRISAAAPTPLAERFTKLREATLVMEGPQAPADWLSPHAKLAGNELRNYSAFFKRAWRDNDWLWGRLDAVPTLVDLLLAARSTAERAELVEKRQREIIQEHFAIDAAEVDEFIGAYGTGLEKLDDSSVPGLADSVDGLAETAAHVASAYAPEQVQRYVIPPVYRLARVVLHRLLASRPASAAGASGQPPRWRRFIAAARPWVLPLAVAAMVVWLAFGVAESKVAVAAGFVAGLVLAPVPLLLVWRALKQPLREKTAAGEPPPSHGAAPVSATVATAAEAPGQST